MTDAAVVAMAKILHDAGVGVYDPENPIPADKIPISISGFTGTHTRGIAVTTYAGGVSPDSRENDEYPRLQVRVRDTAPLAGLDLERDAWQALQFRVGGPSPRAVGDWWVQDIHAIQSEAEPLGRDDAGRWEFVRNYQLHINPLT
ncbi:hypothetical protein SAMN05428985_11035 [Nocardioides sp. YR527]|uniref:minor capsid protein n=1 Tax=Nocardioides sp. YR527 TaxID=1881028 RepID=UPI000887720C|nr:minor capsid protein [Nocardioides sp. YR527]SDL14393.1 hypothetical protein SAMN05428985_11035 [Nocardioides sp. YR527]